VAVQYLDFLTEEEYLDILERKGKENQHLDDSDPNKFIAKMGADALHDLLKRLDLDTSELRPAPQGQHRDQPTAQERGLEAPECGGGLPRCDQPPPNNPEWMIVKVVPVIPPELRPLVPWTVAVSPRPI
jgi:DNA-directed RNA polymerase subunit beta'